MHCSSERFAAFVGALFALCTCVRKSGTYNRTIIRDSQPFAERFTRVYPRRRRQSENRLVAGSYGRTFKSPFYPAFTFSLDDFHSTAAAVIHFPPRVGVYVDRAQKGASRSRIPSRISDPANKRYVPCIVLDTIYG